MRIARFEIVPTLTPRQLFERLELAIAASAPEVSRAGRAGSGASAAKWHSRRVPLGIAALLATAVSATGASAAESSAERSRPRTARRPPIVLALTATHPIVGGARIALGASLVDRARRAGVALAAAGRALRLQRRRLVHGRARRARCAARPGARRSGAPGRRTARRRPAAAPAGACGWRSRCAPWARAGSCSTGAICRRLRARAMRCSCTSCASSSARRPQIVVTVPARAHAARAARRRLRPARARAPGQAARAGVERARAAQRARAGRLARVLEADAAHGAAGALRARAC